MWEERTEKFVVWRGTFHAEDYMTITKSFKPEWVYKDNYTELTRETSMLNHEGTSDNIT